MSDFPYSTNPASVGRFLTQIQNIGKPSSVTLKWLAGLGFKSSSDRVITRILKDLRFTDSSGVPTERWAAFRDKEKGRKVLALALRETYSSLYETYPDAHRKDDEALRNFFSTHSDVGEGAVTYMVRTFKTLVQLADFEAAPVPGPLIPDREIVIPQSDGKIVTQVPIQSPAGLSININIQLQLPATENATIYDKLFEALKKHLLS